MPENAFLCSDVRGSVHNEESWKNCLQMKEEVDATKSGRTNENKSQGQKSYVSNEHIVNIIPCM